MSTISPTVLDVSRAVANLCEYADMPANSSRMVDGIELTREGMRQRVASNLAHHYRRVGLSPQKRTIREIVASLAVHGADPFAIDQHATAIARYVRADYSS